MPNLKLDLINRINNDKYLDELELVRLAQDPNMNYRQKIDEMCNALESIAILNAEAGLIEEYFKEPAKANMPAPTGQVHQGQSHGE